MTHYSIRRATRADVARIAELHDEATQWLASWGSDQWQYPAPVEVIERDVRRGIAYVVTGNNTDIAASATIDDRADPDFWFSEDNPDDALYVHKMAVDRRQAGIGLGSALLDYAGELAERQGRSWIRLDAWKTNTGLHRYYQDQGFALLRIMDLPHRPSGALLQREASARKSEIRFSS